MEFVNTYEEMNIVECDILFVSSAADSIDKEEIRQLCYDLIQSADVLGYDIATLLAIYDEFDKEDSEDEYYSDAMHCYPVRVMVLKSLIAYSDEDETEFFLNNVQHKALVMMKEAREETIHHDVSSTLLTEEASCVCGKPVAAEDVFVCNSCNIVTCPECAEVPCVVALMRFIKSHELDDAAEECDISFWKEDESDEEGLEEEEMEISDTDAELLREMEMSDSEDSDDEEMEF